MKFKVYGEATDCSGSSLLIIFDLIKMRFHYSFLETSTTIKKNYWAMIIGKAVLRKDCIRERKEVRYLDDSSNHS